MSFIAPSFAADSVTSQLIKKDQTYKITAYVYAVLFNERCKEKCPLSHCAFACKFLKNNRLDGEGRNVSKVN